MREVVQYNYRCDICSLSFTPIGITIYLDETGNIIVPKIEDHTTRHICDTCMIMLVNYVGARGYIYHPPVANSTSVNTVDDDTPF